ncbi:hypothetical protein CK203_094557 [Vitis vinifera]|uniref:Uncharacterized protein n=1 Tax=Vitis vinifera TaxID=29760 RepID=A0A438CJN0_VITVI|nr:hypothetical protein CK203_094557 [Vitis vinifera]
MKNQALELHSPLPNSFKVCKERTMERGKQSKEKQGGKQRTAAAVFFGTFGALTEVHFLHSIYRFKAQEVKNPTLQTVFSKYGCYVMAWMQSHGNFSHPEVISYELLEGEVFNSKFCINPLEPISMAIEREKASSKSQWGSKYALNGDDSYEHTVGECPTIPTMRDMYGYQSSYTSSWNNHPNLTTQPQPQPSMSTSSLEQAILKISKVMEDFVGEQQKINSHLNEKIDNMESSINVRMEGVYNDLSLRIEKVQDSIEKLTNLDIARGKRKLPPQPHHNLQGTNAKRSRKVQDDKGLPEPFKASTSPGKRRETNSLGPNGKDANFVWDPGGIQHEVGMMLAKIEVMMKEKEERREFWPLVLLQLSGHIWSTFSSPFYTYYIPFLSSGSQESNASNGVQIGVETKKLWSLQETWTELSGNFAHLNPRCEKFRTVRNTSWHTSAISHTSSPFRTVRNKVRKFRTPLFKVRNSFQGAKISVQGASISHTSIQGAKNFRTVRNTLLAHECHFAHLKPIFARCETRCEFLSPKYGNFARCNSRCEILILRCENFATVGHNFEALSGAQIMHMICHFKAWEVRNPVLQTVHDLDLKYKKVMAI